MKGVPSVQVSLIFTKIEFKYTVPATGEIVEAGYLHMPDDPSGAE